MDIPISSGSDAPESERRRTSRKPPKITGSFMFSLFWLIWWDMSLLYLSLMYLFASQWFPFSFGFIFERPSRPKSISSSTFLNDNYPSVWNITIYYDIIFPISYFHILFPSCALYRTCKYDCKHGIFLRKQCTCTVSAQACFYLILLVIHIL